MRKEIQERMNLEPYDVYGLTEIIGPGVAVLLIAIATFLQFTTIGMAAAAGVLIFLRVSSSG